MSVLLDQWPPQQLSHYQWKFARRLSGSLDLAADHWPHFPYYPGLLQIPEHRCSDHPKRACSLRFKIHIWSPSSRPQSVAAEELLKWIIERMSIFQPPL